MEVNKAQVEKITEQRDAMYTRTRSTYSAVYHVNPGHLQLSSENGTGSKR